MQTTTSLETVSPALAGTQTLPTPAADVADALRYLVASKPREIHAVKLAGW